MKLKIKKHLKYFAMIVFLLFIQALRYYPFKFGEWNQIQLSFNYEYGLVQRAFLGTVLNMISKVFSIPWQYMRYIYVVATILVFTLVLFFIVYKSVNKKGIDNNSYLFFLGLALVFFAGPGWCTFFEFSAASDWWVLMVSLLGMYIVMRGKHLWAVLIIAAIGVLMHTAYVFLYFNLVLCCFFYKLLLDEKSNKKKYLVYSVLTFVIGGALFVYMMFYSHVSDNVTVDYVVGKTAEFLGEDASELQQSAETIKGYLFREGDVSGVQFVINSFKFILILTIVMFVPFITEIFRYWKMAVCNAKSTGGGYIGYALLPLGIVTTMPMYIMHNDYGRWTYAALFYEFAVIWVLNLTEDANIEQATRLYMNRVRNNKIYFVILITYAAIIGALEQNLINPVITSLEPYCWKIMELF